MIFIRSAAFIPFLAIQFIVSSSLTASRYSDGSSSLSTLTQRRKKGISLNVRKWRKYEDDREFDNISRQRSVDRPTETVFDELGPKLSPEKPKIVVLGATGMIGRSVVRQLLEMDAEDMTIVAFVRDYDKAINVLYDDLILAKNNGPRLQIIKGDLVPQEELPGFIEDTEEEKVWAEKAKSTIKFYDDNMSDYDNRELLPDLNEGLEESIKDCTTIISCVGAVRPTNFWTDIVSRPLWRLLKADVSSWCTDGRHPYYVHYASTRKALGFAEREQLRREAAAEALAEARQIDPDSLDVPKIRYVRISDLCVGHKPWNFIPLVTNIIHSVVFRYQEMTEKLLDQSNIVETFILRPGDLVDDERDVKTTGLQVCSNIVPSPARVGREDVASLAVAAAMFQSKKESSNDKYPFHYTLGVRWVGQDMAPFPSQGRKTDGLETAGLALKRCVKTINKAEKRIQRRKRLKKKDAALNVQSDIILRMSNQLQRRKRRLQPHGICTAVPVYFFLILFLKTIVYPVLQYLPGGKTLLLPALRRLAELGSLLFMFLIRHAKQRLPYLARRKQYILF